MSLPSPSPATAALVTGASAGIGACIARELASAATASYWSRAAANAWRSWRKSCRKRTGSAPRRRRDLSKAASVARLPGRIESLGLDVDILVNNAGFATGGPFHESDPERELEQVRVLVEAVVALTVGVLAEDGQARQAARS